MPMPYSVTETRARGHPSRAIDSTQDDIHPGLPGLLEKHFLHDFRRPITDKTRQRFEALKVFCEGQNELILDAGCGTGHATRTLARRFPEALVIGVDKSRHRLARGGVHHALQDEANCLFLRMDLVDFWILAQQQGLKLRRHYLLYPNPWPKPRHLQRRWHGHAVFPIIMALGGILELRCNWLVYAREFQRALRYAGLSNCRIEIFSPMDCISLFEKKYHHSGLTLYRCVADLVNLVKDNHKSGALQPDPVTSESLLASKMNKPKL